MNDEITEELKQIVRVGIISSVNGGNLTAKVKFVQQKIMSGDMKIMQNHPPEVGDWIPEPGQYVLCLLVAGGDGDGVILGGI